MTTTKLKWEQSCHKTGPTYTPGRLRVHARYLNGFVCIELDESQDLYNISFFLNKSIEDMLIHPVIHYKTMEGVYCDQLVKFIDNRIEKIPHYKY